MPPYNPYYECQPCLRGNHAWCTLEHACSCPNTWDGEGWKDIDQRLASKANVKSLSTPTTQGSERYSEARPLVGGVVWFCNDCGFKSRWWKGCERFLYCTDCERRHRDIERRKLALEAKAQGAEANGMVVEARRGAGQDAQASLPLSAHRDGRRTDSPCDKKEPSSA